MTKKRTRGTCRGCGECFEKTYSRDYYCSLHCVMLARVAKANDGDCWPWTGATNNHGYGQFSRGGRTHYAHRVAYELHHGPLGRLNVLHRCDNPPCCNPAHLAAGTQGDNVKDMHAKGRWTDRVPRGGQAKHAKLTEHDVIQIRAALARGEALRPLARAYGVSQGCVQEIRRGDTWKHLL